MAFLLDLFLGRLAGMFDGELVWMKKVSYVKTTGYHFVELSFKLKNVLSVYKLPLAIFQWST